MQSLQICIGPIIRIGRESWCLPYAGFLLNHSLRDHSQIMSAAEGGNGVWHILTNTDKGGRGVSNILTTADGDVIRLKMQIIYQKKLSL